MRLFETKEYLNKIDILKELKCDICGKLAEKPQDEWATDSVYYKTHNLKTEVKIEDSIYYSDNGGGYGEVISFDICPECFKDKLIPFIENFGGKPTNRIIDF